MFDILARMSIQIDQFIRSRRRTIAIQIRPNGQVVVRAPLRAPEKVVRDFVESKAGWIERKKVELLKHDPVPGKKFRAGEGLLFLGQEYPLRLVKEKGAALRFEDQFVLS
jgi:predicted metal-dependent hydrolase